MELGKIAYRLETLYVETAAQRRRVMKCLGDLQNELIGLNGWINKINDLWEEVADAMEEE